MSQSKNLREQLDSMIMLRRLAIAGAAVVAVLLILTAGFGVGRDEIEQLDLVGLGAVPLALALVFAIGAFFYGLFGAAAQRESEAKTLLALRRDTSILEAGEDASFGAERTFSNYRKVAPYVLLGLALITGGILLGSFWYYWNVSRPETLYIENYVKPEPDFVRTAVLSAILMAGSILVGAFFIGQARTKEYRWLRPVGAYLVFNFVMMLSAVLVALCGNFGVLDGLGVFFLKVFFALNGLLMVELLINLIVEFYRPRTQEGASHPVFESKLLGIFTEPGGVMRNIAELLDYQFGFKVSGTYVYSFIERSLFPLLLLWSLMLWLSTSMTQVEPGAVGVRESFGKVVDGKLLEPGIYFSKPWPFGKVAVYSYLKLHQISIGNLPNEDEDEPFDDGHDHGDKPEKKKKPKGPEYIVRWENAHDHGGIYYLVNSSESNNTKVLSGSAAQSLDMVCFYIPIQYRIRKDGVFDYAYGHINPESSLARLSEAAATRLLFGMDMRSIMSHQRGDFEQKIKLEVQRLSDAHKLGIEIVAVNLTEVHPPMTDGAALAFYQIKIAQEMARTEEVRSESYREQILPAAELAAEELMQYAESYKYNTVKIAEAEAGRFKTQLATSRILPQMFKLREYLYFWENDCANIRKYIVSKNFKEEVYTFNFEERNVYDILDSQLDSIGEKK